MTRWLARIVECRTVAFLLWDYGTDALAESERERVDRHLESCPGCFTRACEYRLCASAIREVRTAAVPQSKSDWSQLAGRITSAGVASGQLPRPAHRFGWLAGLSAAIIVGLLGTCRLLPPMVMDSQRAQIDMRPAVQPQPVERVVQPTGIERPRVAVAWPKRPVAQPIPSRSEEPVRRQPRRKGLVAVAIGVGRRTAGGRDTPPSMSVESIRVAAVDGTSPAPGDDANRLVAPDPVSVAAMAHVTYVLARAAYDEPAVEARGW
jgi:hypothetical protein